MLPRHHVILGAFFAALVYWIFPQVGVQGATIIFFASFLIDVDHYLYFVVTKKNLSVKKAYNFFNEERNAALKLPKRQRKGIDPKMCLFHGIEVSGLILILGLFLSKIFLFIFAGFIFHLIFDWIEEISWGMKMKKVSLIYSFFIHKD